MNNVLESASSLVVEPRNDGRLLVVRMNRPDAANAFNQDMGDGLLRLADRLERSPEVDAVVITGEGRLFSGGGDLGAFRDALAADGPDSPAFTGLLRNLSHTIHGALARIVASGPLLVAAVNGPVAGAGVGLLCACDVAFARSSASLRAGFSSLGLTPDTGTTYYLPRIVGYRKALEILIGGALVDAHAAVALGIYNEVLEAPGPEFLELVVQRTDKLIAAGRCARETRRLLRISQENCLQEQLDLERAAIVAMSQNPAVVRKIREAVGLK